MPDIDTPLSTFEHGRLRDQIELEFDRALVEEKLLRGMNVTEDREKGLRIAVIPSVFLTFMDAHATASMSGLSDDERRLLSHEMTVQLRRELDR